MNHTRKDKGITLLFALVFFGGFLLCVTKKDTVFSDSERRYLATFPAPSMQSVRSGRFMEDFETYTTDQFPYREAFRSLRALTVLYGFGQRDKDLYYRADGYLSKMDYPLDAASLQNACDKFNAICERYQSPTAHAYFSVIPDKNYYLGRQNGYLYVDPQEVFAFCCERLPHMTGIDITDTLSLSSYYRTDTHWRQETLLPTARLLAERMGALGGDAPAPSWQTGALPAPFYGVYRGQSALPVPGEPLYYLTNQTLEECMVYDYETRRTTSVYDWEKARAKDPYELFLSGPKSLLTVTNPHATSPRRLILFRDSFASVIAPLLMPCYAEITLVDIRYLSSNGLSRFIDFTECDLLFLYSTMVLNNSVTLK